MNNYKQTTLLLLFFGFVFSSCNEKEQITPEPEVFSYFLNEDVPSMGNYQVYEEMVFHHNGTFTAIVKEYWDSEETNIPLGTFNGEDYFKELTTIETNGSYEKTSSSYNLKFEIIKTSYTNLLQGETCFESEIVSEEIQSSSFEMGIAEISTWNGESDNIELCVKEMN